MAGQPTVPTSMRLDEARKLRRPSREWMRVFLVVAGLGIPSSLWMNDSIPEPRPACKVEVTSGTSTGGLTFHRSAYHFQPPRNWINDPNGPMFYKGLYHLFYQYNPGGATWGNLTWGHAVSENLVDWLILEPALVCDQWYDAGGVWSGSVTIRPDGAPIILYTGVHEDLTETQNVALPVDPTDSYLRKWAKIPENPILRHPEGVDKEHFRDPTSAWQLDDGSWRMIVGTQFGTYGTALLYRSDDLVHWELMERRLCVVPDTGMWGCLDFFPVSSVGQAGLDYSVRGPLVKHVLKVSAVNTKRDYYAVGSYDVTVGAFTPANPDLDVVYALQYGKFCSSKSLFDPVKQRRINWGWSNESDTQAHDVAKGWASVLGIPRTMWLDSELDDNLIQAPVKELESLRGAKPVSRAEVELEAGSVMNIEGSSGGQLDIEVVFKYPGAGVVSKVGMDDGRHPFDHPFDCNQGGSAQRGVFGPFGLLVMADEALQEQTAVFFYISQSYDGRWATFFCNDHSRFIDLPAMLIQVHVFLSNAIGLVCIISFNNGTAHVTLERIDIWQMKSITVREELESESYGTQPAFALPSSLEVLEKNISNVLATWMSIHMTYIVHHIWKYRCIEHLPPKA